MKFLGKNEKIKSKTVVEEEEGLRVHRDVRSCQWHEEKPGEGGQRDNTCKLVKTVGHGKNFWRTRQAGPTPPSRFPQGRDVPHLEGPQATQKKKGGAQL